MANETHPPISDERISLNPMITPQGQANLSRIQQHISAPRWTRSEMGDRASEEDLEALAAFRIFLEKAPRPGFLTAPPSHVLAFVEAAGATSSAIAERLDGIDDLDTQWGSVPTTSREDLMSRLSAMVPVGVDFSRMVAYDTSGTTGHAIQIPSHPATVARAHAFAEQALKLWGVPFEPGPEDVACMNVCAQYDTLTFPTVFSAWNQAGFAKINLNPATWAGGIEAARAFMEDLSPLFLTGTPLSFEELMRWEVPVRPGALISTAVGLEAPVRERLAGHFQCPVIDWYSTTETGPIAYDHPDGKGKWLAAQDLFVEIVDEDGRPLPMGEHGAIAVTGGRNPYLPLLRYRTGDSARLVEVGGSVRLVELEGRAALMFRGAHGEAVNAVDIARVLRHVAVFAQHKFVQKADGSRSAVLRPMAGVPIDTEAVKRGLEEIFFGGEVAVSLDAELGGDGGKVAAYVLEA